MTHEEALNWVRREARTVAHNVKCEDEADNLEGMIKEFSRIDRTPCRICEHFCNVEWLCEECCFYHPSRFKLKENEEGVTE